MDDTRAQLIPAVRSALPPGYELVDTNWRPSVGDSLEALGGGGSSLVLRALHRERMRRALKIFIPRPDLADRIDMRYFVDSYENEVARQAELSHENLSKITDFGKIQVGGREYPFIATEYVAGQTLLQYCQSESQGSRIIQVLVEVLAALNFMHLNGVMHCDLKVDNVLVKSGLDLDPDKAVLVDLGSSKYFPATDDGKEDELLHLFTTPSIVPESLEYAISNNTLNRISRRNLRRHFPYLDLHAFGVIIEKLLEDDRIRRKLSSAASNGEVFDYIASKLRNAKSGGDSYQEASEVQNALGRLTYRTLAPLGVPELGPTPRRGVVIPGLRTRIHGGGRVDRVMSHPLFQRFHSLPQLDLLYWTLPGATNTRYVHAAHAFDITRQALSYLLNDWRIRQEIQPADIEATLYSSLINQVGHYHFLHMFEDFIEERNHEPKVQAAKLLRDDELLDSVLGLSESEIGAELAGIKDERGRTFPSILSSLDLDWADLRQRQRTPSTPLQGLLSALLSGPLDVEKLAYLHDDSVATGVQFGLGLDGSPIFESIVIPDKADWLRGEGRQRLALGVTEQAMAYLEYGILARYWSIQTAYWNRTNRAVQSMLKFQIACLIRADLFNFPAYIRETLHLGPDGALRWINEKFRAAISSGQVDGSTVNPMEDLLESRRVIYRRLLTISGKSAISNREPDHHIFRRVQALSPLDDSTMHHLVVEALQQVDSTLHIHPGEVLLDLPRARRDETEGRILVYTEDTREYMGELFTISPNLRQHQESFEHYVKRMRIYLHPRVHEKLRQRNRLKAAHDATLEALRFRFAR